MKKMDGKSLDLTEQNIEKLKTFFPQVVTENQIDFEKLRLILGDEVDTGPEKYQFTWPGKADSIRLAQEPSTKTLRPVMEDSKDWDTTKNLYIEGDNLEVLKQLQKTYHGKVDMIYIDPPYNTGNDFVYNDKFGQSSEDYKIETDQGLISNPETSGRYHSNWLNMMYPRLLLSKHLLSKKGVIFISIDENEVHNMRKICDEIFGETNFVMDLIRKTKSTTNDANTGINYQHEFLLCYSKNINEVNLLGGEKDFGNRYSNPDNDPNGDWASGDPSAKTGTFENNYFPVKNPYTGKVDFPPEGMFWRFSKNTLKKHIDYGTISFKKEHRDNERGFIYKRYKKDLKTTLETLDSLKFTENQYMNQAATKEINRLKFAGMFPYPKSVAYLKDIIIHGSNKDSLILDFFSGSSTTAHAVMKLNAEDGGNRQFIMVQLPEGTDEKSEAYKAGYENICEIGKERIRRAGEQIKEELKEKQSKGEDVRDPDTLDIGFKVFRLDETNIVPWEGKKVEDEEAQIDLLTMLEEVYKEDRSSLDIAYEIMLKYGVFDHQLEKIIINDKEMFDVGEGYMLICLSENIYMDDIQEIGKKGYMHVIFNDRSFKDDNVKLNAEHSLKNMGVEEVVSI